VEMRFDDQAHEMPLLRQGKAIFRKSADVSASRAKRGADWITLIC
jgi:hypothetical protein